MLDFIWPYLFQFRLRSHFLTQKTGNVCEGRNAKIMIVLNWECKSLINILDFYSEKYGEFIFIALPLVKNRNGCNSALLSLTCFW